MEGFTETTLQDDPFTWSFRRFELPRENGVMKVALKQEGDEIKGDITREREGEKQTAQLAVKRDK